MPRFAASLTMLFTEQLFVDRFSATGQAGFRAVEFLFPYKFQADDLANRLAEENLHQVLFNLPPGDWDAGERGVAALPGRQSEFLEGLERALEYAGILKCPTLQVMAGIPLGGVSHDEALEVYIENLRLACNAASCQRLRLLLNRLIPGMFRDTCLVVQIRLVRSFIRLGATI